MMRFKRHPEKRIRYHYICGNHSRFGKYYCFNHYIRREVIEELVLSDIRAKADFVRRNEKQAREDFLRRKEQAGIAEVNAIKGTRNANISIRFRYGSGKEKNLRYFNHR